MFLSCVNQCYSERSSYTMKISLAPSCFVFTILLAGVFLTTADEGKKQFAGYKVYSVVPTTENELNILQTIEEQDERGVEFWASAGRLNSRINVMVSPDKDEHIRSTFQKAGLSHELLIENLQTLINNENRKFARSSGINDNVSLDLTAYQRLDPIYDWLDELAETHPDRVKIVVIGNSYEGRLIKGIKITFDENNPGVFVDGGMHAREWISIAVVNYLINEIVTSTNEEFNSVIRSHNWFIFPVTNPDGYEFTHTTNRLWRKTRRPYLESCWDDTGYGADPNRNWDYYWLTGGGASSNPCSGVYAGPQPFSEIEVESLRSYMESVKDQFYVYLNMHSYGNMLLFPYGHTVERPDNYDEAMHIGQIAAAALYQKYGTEYQVGTAFDIIWVSSGISIDYVRATFKTPIVYSYELRGNRTYGFLLPAEQIVPTSLEFIDSLIAMLEEAKNLGYPKTNQL